MRKNGNKSFRSRTRRVQHARKRSTRGGRLLSKLLKQEVKYATQS